MLPDDGCPAVPATFAGECVRRAEETGRVVVAVRPVTDTVKVLRHGFVGSTVDRDGLVTVCAPVVVPAAVAAEAGPMLDGDVMSVVPRLSERYPVEQVEAPTAARRVRDADDLALLFLLADGDAEAGG